mgnify:CR=1 FL=1
MWRSKATAYLKLKSVEIEAATKKELAERGLIPSRPAGAGEGGAQSAPETEAASSASAAVEAEIDPVSSAPAELGVPQVGDPPLEVRRKRRRDPRLHSAQEGEPQAPIGVTSPDRTPSRIGTPMASPAAQSSGSPPRPRRRLRRLGETSTIGESSHQAAATEEAPAGHPSIKTTLRFPSEEYLLSADRPLSPVHEITLTGPLAKLFEDAQIQVALMTPKQLGDNNMQQATQVNPSSFPCHAIV